MKKFSLVIVLLATLSMLPLFSLVLLAQEPPPPPPPYPPLGSIVHIEIPTTDFQKSKAFYEALFGWKVQIDTVMNYAMFETSAPPGGGFVKWDKINQDKEVPLFYILVSSVEDMTQKAEALGARVCMSKQEVPGMGWFAVFTDPVGAPFAIWEGMKR